MQILQLHDLMQDNCLLSFFPPFFFFFFFFFFLGGGGSDIYHLQTPLLYTAHCLYYLGYLVRIIICDIRCVTLQYIMPPCSTKSCGI